MGSKRSFIFEVRSETAIQLVKGVMIYSMQAQLARSGFLEETLKTGESICSVDESQD